MRSSTVYRPQHMSTVEWWQPHRIVHAPCPSPVSESRQMGRGGPCASSNSVAHNPFKNPLLKFSGGGPAAAHGGPAAAQGGGRRTVVVRQQSMVVGQLSGRGALPRPYRARSVPAECASAPCRARPQAGRCLPPKEHLELS